jgi:hypothetical protein
MKLIHRPWLIRAYNFFNWDSTLELADLIASAEKKTGLKDFGKDPFKEGLERLLQSIKQEAKLHAFGRFITKQRIVNVLANRLRIEAIIKKNPEILHIEIKAPIIITGLQRTGTTRLHRLLSAHKDVRALLSWEALQPAPIANDIENKQRIQFAKTAERALKYMSPDFFAIHPVEHLAPEEDILLNDMSFVSTVPEATMHVPSYAAWVEIQSHLHPYTYLKKVLQVLTWQHPKSRWVLKTPQYLEFLEESLQVFPDAYIIHTYRDPLKVIPSFSSMVYQSRVIFSDEVDAKEVANHWLKKNSYMMNKAIDYWDKNAASKVLHLSYYDMLKDAKSNMQKIFSFVGLEMNESIVEALETIDKENTQHKYGVHQYDLADFGLSPTDVNTAFDMYRKKFNIPYE